MNIHLYTVKGKLRIGRQIISFKKIVPGVKVNDVIEKIYCELGSCHKIKRKQIIIEKITEKV
ncbi:MAG: 50S ribosomal protein L18Ae [Candidatus Methanomethylicia archaeon]